MAATPRTSIARILCPIDFSDISHHALAHAAAIAKWYEAQLTMLYVFVSLPTVDVPPVVLEDEDRSRLIAQMRELAGIVPREVPVACRVREARLVPDGMGRERRTSGSVCLVLG